MKEDAEKHAEEDAAKKEGIEIKNQAETLVFQTEKTLKDAGDKVPVEVGQKVTEKVEVLKELLKQESPDLEKLKAGIEDLNEEIQQIGASMYQQPDDENVTVHDNNDEEVVDGEEVEEEAKEEKE